MFAIARFRIDLGEREKFMGDLALALGALAACPGYRSGRIGANTDEPELMALITEWVNIGSYRRALSNYQVKLTAVPILARAIDEPGGYIESNE